VESSIAERELEEVESQWQQSRAEVEELQAMIARKTIVAPFRGRVGLSDVHKGQYLAPGSLITTLQSVEDHLLVEFTLAQYVVSEVETGDPVQLLTASQELPATISAIDAQADRETRNVRVRARIDSPPDSLSPGDSVSVRVEYGPAMEVPAVPAESVRRSPQGTFVFLAEKTQAGELRASARPVVIATSAGSLIGVASGIAPGDQVVVEGSFKLHDGALIVPVGSDSGQSAAPDATTQTENPDAPEASGSQNN
jgi:membrane fusion protein (multidrug efflux system)